MRPSFALPWTASKHRQEPLGRPPEGHEKGMLVFGVSKGGGDAIAEIVTTATGERTGLGSRA